MKPRVVLSLMGLLLLGVLLSGCVSLQIFRVPVIIARGDPASGPNQWFARVGLTEDGAAGVKFRYVAWLHVPDDWELPWATQYSFTGDFQNTPLSQSADARAWIETPGNCDVLGGAAESGYKWRAFIGPIEDLPVQDTNSRYINNLVNLRGGLRVPLTAAAGAKYYVRVIVGSYYDSDSDDVPDSYYCSGATNALIYVSAASP